MLEKGTNKVVVLSGQVSDDSPLDPGVVLNYANDVDIAQDGTVYLTTSSEIPVVPNKFGFHDTFSTFSLTMLQVRKGKMKRNRKRKRGLVDFVT